jgi:hypothetical protein
VWEFPYSGFENLLFEVVETELKLWDEKVEELEFGFWILCSSKRLTILGI